MRVFGELRRRNVFKVSVAYVISSWLLVRVLHAVAVTGGRIEQYATVALILAFPIVVLFAWAYEITPQGLKPTADVDKSQSTTAETGRRLNYILLALLALAAAALLLENIV